MPNASNFTIKDGASTPADVVFTNIQPAGGNLPAVYIAKTKGPAVASQPKLAISSSGSSKTRESRITLKTPYWVTGTDGVTKTMDSAFTEIRTVMPDSVPDAVRADHVAFIQNSLDQSQVAMTMHSGYAPT